MVKSYKGGYSILDTTPITFELEDSGSIYDSYILEQLLEILAPHYNNYLKELKPIYLRYVTDDFGLAVTLCSLTRQSNDFYIKGELGTNTLEIYVELGLDDDGNVIIESTGFEYYPLSLNIQNLIDGGNIEVGTKLYKHTLTFDSTHICSVISINNSVQTISTLDSFLCRAFIIKDEHLLVGSSLVYDGDNGILFYIHGDTQFMDLADYNSVQDTVTPL